MTKFDRILWRVNGLFLLSFVLLAIAVGSYAAVKIYRLETRTRYVSDMVKVEGKEGDKVNYVMGNFDSIHGTSYYMASLHREDSYNYDHYSKSASSEVNYLFFDSKTKKSRWLLKDRSHLIIRRERIFKDLSGRRDDLSPVSAFLFCIVKEDSNGDGRLSRKDKVDILFSDVRGKSRMILEKVKFQGFNQEDHNNSILFVERDGKVEAIKISNVNGDVLSTTSIELK